MKRRFWAGPPWNAAIVATLPILGALADDRHEAAAIVHAAPIGWLVATAFFAYATFVLLGYLKDVDADRAAGYTTLPVRFGRAATIAVSLGCAIVAIGTSLPLVAGGGAAAALWTASAAALVVAHAQAWKVTADRDAHAAIVTGLRGYVALHVAIAIALRPPFLPVGIGVLGAFELLLARRPCKEQV
jgi:4-hydroxybenzoate polyprenyltransferase/geranylgeranylglycerol-phosphate geranylgeranyltransferase